MKETNELAVGAVQMEFVITKGNFHLCYNAYDIIVKVSQFVKSK